MRGEVDEVGEEHGHLLALTTRHPGQYGGTARPQRLDGGRDDHVAQRLTLCFEGGDGVVDRSQIIETGGRPPLGSSAHQPTLTGASTLTIRSDQSASCPPGSICSSNAPASSGRRRARMIPSGIDSNQKRKATVGLQKAMGIETRKRITGVSDWAIP